MKILVSIFLLCLCTAALSQISGGDNNGTSPEQNVTSSTSPSETTTVVVTTTEKPTSVPSTTPVPTTSTSDASTTEAPVTTTSPSPSPSPSPTPSPAPLTSTAAPEPKKCNWTVTEKDVTCIKAELQAKFLIPVGNKTIPLLLGCDASTEKSDCSSNETQTLVLSEEDYEFTLIFEKKEGKVYVRNTSLVYSLPERKGKVGNNSDTIFTVNAGNSYLCKTAFTVELDDVTMQVDEIHIQAFGDTSKDFGKAQECDADDKVDDIVPIAVGVALGALIIIVLIAYLVGRRRSRQKGYQSV